jgi:hypothetical protein
MSTGKAKGDVKHDREAFSKRSAARAAARQKKLNGQAPEHPLFSITCRVCGAGFRTWSPGRTRCSDCTDEWLRNLPPDEIPTPAAVPPPVKEHKAADLGNLVANAPGLLGGMVEWMTATAVSPQPFLSLGASLCTIGTLAGHKYRLDRPDTRSNLYIIALGDSGSGKDHPRQCVRRVLHDAGLEEHLGGESIMSESGLREAVTDQPRLLYQIDEFGHVIAAALDRRRPMHHLRGIVTLLTTLWSSSTQKVRGADYADKKLRMRRTIVEPCVSLYGSTVPRTFWSALQSGNVDDGSLARFLIFESPENYPDKQKPAPITEGLPEIVAGLTAVAVGVPVTGNIAPFVIAPYVVPMDAEAAAADDVLMSEHVKMQRAHEGTAFSPIIARYHEHIRRVALIAAVAENPAQPVCTGAHIAWATALVRHCQQTLVAGTERYVADNDYEATRKRVLETLRRHGGWMTGHILAKRLGFVDRRRRGEIIGDLVEADLVEMVKEPGKTKPQLLVRAKA